MFTTPGSKSKIGQSFSRGTTMLFYQAAAPFGWTKLTTQNDKALRVVSGAGGVAGGTNSFSSVMAQTVVGSTTLSTAQIPSHSHGSSGGSYILEGDTSQMSNPGGASPLSQPNKVYPAVGTTTATQGGGTSHNHTITMLIQYIDLILASKN